MESSLPDLLQDLDQLCDHVRENLDTIDVILSHLERSVWPGMCQTVSQVCILVLAENFVPAVAPLGMNEVFDGEVEAFEEFFT